MLWNTSYGGDTKLSAVGQRGARSPGAVVLSLKVGVEDPKNELAPGFLSLIARMAASSPRPREANAQLWSTGGVRGGRANPQAASLPSCWQCGGRRREKAGRLRHWLRIERPDPGSLDVPRRGQALATVAEVRRHRQRDRARVHGADRELAGITWRITLREIPGVCIEPGWRGVEIDGDTARTFDFIAILPSHARNDLTLAATSGQSQP